MQAPSAARVICDDYGPEKFEKFAELLEYVDKVDSGQLTEEEILNPSGWVLLGFICDPRTGLGYHKEYGISDFQLMRDLMGYLGEKSIDEIMVLPDVQQRGSGSRKTTSAASSS